jgi:hypothetical protein
MTAGCRAAAPKLPSVERQSGVAVSQKQTGGRAEPGNAFRRS